MNITINPVEDITDEQAEKLFSNKKHIAPAENPDVAYCGEHRNGRPIHAFTLINVCPICLSIYNNK